MTPWVRYSTYLVQFTAVTNDTLRRFTVSFRLIQLLRVARPTRYKHQLQYELSFTRNAFWFHHWHRHGIVCYPCDNIFFQVHPLGEAAETSVACTTVMKIGPRVGPTFRRCPTLAIPRDYEYCFVLWTLQPYCRARRRPSY